MNHDIKLLPSSSNNRDTYTKNYWDYCRLPDVEEIHTHGFMHKIFCMQNGLLGKITEIVLVFFYQAKLFLSRPHIINTKLPTWQCWYDVDEIMFHACFNLLGRFVENEMGIASVDENNYRGYRVISLANEDKEAVDLWLWYRFELPTVGYEVGQAKDAKFTELMEIRKSLWS